jgi:HSP20 family protein
MNYMITRGFPPRYALPAVRRMHWLDEAISRQDVPVDVEEQDEKYVLTAQLPGVNKEDIQVSVEKDILTLAGTYAYQRDENASYLLSERSSGEFKRTFRLPAQVDAEKIEARLADGILTLEIPKPAAIQPRNIKVN